MVVGFGRIRATCGYVVTHLEVLDSADGAVVLAEGVVEDDAGPLARGEFGLAQERDPAAFRAADPNLKENERGTKTVKVGEHHFLFNSDKVSVVCFRDGWAGWTELMSMQLCAPIGKNAEK